MNSKSQIKCNEVHENSCKDFNDQCFDNSCAVEKSGSVFIKCGKSYSATITSENVKKDHFLVGTIAVEIADINDGLLKLDFASTISVDSTFAGTLIFQVFKRSINQLSNNYGLPIGPSWFFSVSTAAAASSREFSFFTFDRSIFSNECTTYNVVAIVTSDSVAGNANITPTTLDVLVVND